MYNSKTNKNISPRIIEMAKSLINGKSGYLNDALTYNPVRDYPDISQRSKSNPNTLQVNKHILTNNYIPVRYR